LGVPRDKFEWRTFAAGLVETPGNGIMSGWRVEQTELFGICWMIRKNFSGYAYINLAK
jgi:hypothetical protein